MIDSGFDIKKQFESKFDPTHYSEESLMLLLGLDPGFTGIEGAPPGRARGRTTKTLIRAAVKAQRSRVAVLGHNLAYTHQLESGLREMCRRSGISDSNVFHVKSSLADINKRLRYFHGISFFYDHTCHEFAHRRI